MFFRTEFENSVKYLVNVRKATAKFIARTKPEKKKTDEIQEDPDFKV